MNTFLRKLFAVVLGIVMGSALNMGLILLGQHLVPLPAGVDVHSMAGLQAALPLFEPKHFLFPFLAHALGTFLGALIASLLAAGSGRGPAAIVGGWFLLGGLTNVFLLGGPLWFNAADVLLAYLPMTYLGDLLARRTAVSRRS